MAPDRLSTVLRTLADTDPQRPIVDRVCDTAVTLLSLSGAGLSLMADGQIRGTAGVSSPRATMLQELQLECGEGPSTDTWRTRAPVLEGDLHAPLGGRWPAFARAASAQHVRAVFALPVALGAIQIGVLLLYRDRPGSLTGEELAEGLLLADVAAR